MPTTGPIAHKVVNPGAYNIAVPRGKLSLVLEVTSDRDGNGKPSLGAFFVSIDRAGKLVPNRDRNGLIVKVGGDSPY